MLNFILIYLAVGAIYAIAMAKLGDPEDLNAPFLDLFVFSRMNISGAEDEKKAAIGLLVVIWPVAMLVDLSNLLLVKSGTIILNFIKK